MTSKTKKNLFKEKLILKEEETSLKKMLDKFQDQLNRLKIEELALVHLLRMQKSKEAQQNEDDSVPSATSDKSQDDANNVGISNYLSSYSQDQSDMDEEESLSDKAVVGYLEKTIGEDNATMINREVIDLNVPQGTNLTYTSNTLTTQRDTVNEGEEEEEEEEEELESDDMEEASAPNEIVTNQLRTFMDGF